MACPTTFRCSRTNQPIAMQRRHGRGDGIQGWCSQLTAGITVAGGYCISDTACLQYSLDSLESSLFSHPHVRTGVLWWHPSTDGQSETGSGYRIRLSEAKYRTSMAFGMASLSEPPPQPQVGVRGASSCSNPIQYSGMVAMSWIRWIRSSSIDTTVSARGFWRTEVPPCPPPSPVRAEKRIMSKDRRASPTYPQTPSSIGIR